jgi:hypothetical protein
MSNEAGVSPTVIEDTHKFDDFIYRLFDKK